MATNTNLEERKKKLHLVLMSRNDGYTNTAQILKDLRDYSGDDGIALALAHGYQSFQTFLESASMREYCRFADEPRMMTVFYGVGNNRTQHIEREMQLSLPAELEKAKKDIRNLRRQIDTKDSEISKMNHIMENMTGQLKEAKKKLNETMTSDPNLLNPQRQVGFLRRSDSERSDIPRGPPSVPANLTTRENETQTECIDQDEIAVQAERIVDRLASTSEKKSADTFSIQKQMCEMRNSIGQLCDKLNDLADKFEGAKKDASEANKKNNSNFVKLNENSGKNSYVMSSQEKGTVSRPNDENESISEVSSAISLRKENDRSIWRLSFDDDYFSGESFEMYKPPHNYGKPCAEKRELVNIESKPQYFTGRREIYKADNSDRKITLEITFGHEYDLFSCTFKNEITDESWPHIQYWFTRLLEPSESPSSVRLVPFDMKIWNDLKKNHPNVMNRIYTLELEIDFELHELNWVIKFASKYCIAKTLAWWLGSVYKNDSNCDEDGVILTKECLDTIGRFIEIQGHNFHKLEIESLHSYNIDELAVEIVKTFQGHEDPSNMIKEISLAQFDDKHEEYFQMEQIRKGFPFCLDENTSNVFQRTYKNLNSEYVLETTQDKSHPGCDLKTVYFSVIEPTSH